MGKVRVQGRRRAKPSPCTGIRLRVQTRYSAMRASLSDSEPMPSGRPSGPCPTMLAILGLAYVMTRIFFGDQIGFNDDADVGRVEVAIDHRSLADKAAK